MKMLLKVAALVLAFISTIEAQYNYVPAQVLIPVYNFSNWSKPVLNNTVPSLNRTHVNVPVLNNTRWNLTTPNRTQWNSSVPIYPVWNNTSNHTTPNGDIIVGEIGYLDRLLFNEIYYKPRRWWSGREKIIEYPKDLPGKSSYNRHETITAIRIYNKFYDGLDSKAGILAGGVRHRYVKIKLSSGKNKGFRYLVQIFGR